MIGGGRWVKVLIFCGVLRYWVRYLIFMAKVDEVLDFTGFDGILVEWFDF